MAVVNPTDKYWAEGRIIMSGSAAMGGQRLFDADDENHAARIVRQLNRYDDLQRAAEETLEVIDASKSSAMYISVALRVGNLGVATSKLRNSLESLK